MPENAGESAKKTGDIMIDLTAVNQPVRQTEIDPITPPYVYPPSTSAKSSTVNVRPKDMGSLAYVPNFTLDFLELDIDEY